MKERVEKLYAKLEHDEKLREKLFALEDSIGMQALLKEEDLPFTLEEIDAIRALWLEAAEVEKKGELTEEILEGVAGGSQDHPIYNLLRDLNIPITDGIRKSISRPGSQRLR